jgi:4-amino-4-deoxy-L-arabinose transferase-like glycosyltransferase
MIQGRDWMVPHFNNLVRYDKPPLIYWLQAIMMRLLGDADWVVRLPSILASALTSFVIFAWARRTDDEKTAFWAAVSYATSLQVLAHSKLCVADPLMIFFVTLGAWAGWEMMRGGADDRRRRLWVWPGIFVVAMSLGFLAKGPIAWVPFGMLGIARWRRMPGCLSYWQLALLLGISTVPVMFWAIPALQATRGEFLTQGIGRHVVERGVTPLDGHGARGLIPYFALLPFYLVTIFLSYFPWSIWLPWVAKEIRNRFMEDDFTIYLISGVAPVIGIFTFYNTRLPHYILPAFPFLALLHARTWIHAERRSRGLRTAAIGITTFALATSLIIFPLLRNAAPAIQLAKASNGLLRREMEFAAVDYDEPSLVWYFRRKIDGFMATIPITQVRTFMEAPGPRFCVLPAGVVAEQFAHLPANWHATQDFEGINLVNGRRVRLKLLIKTD